MKFCYVIDADDRIIEVDDAWLDFARENEALGLDGKGVLGRSIWEFLAGRETKYLYRLIFDAVRARGRAMTFPFRCDSPELRRFMELKVTPGKGGELALEGLLIRTERRPAVALLAADRPASSDMLSMCSWCKRVRLPDGSWVEVEQAISALQLFAGGLLPAISHGICPDCLDPVKSQLFDVR